VQKNKSLLLQNKLKIFIFDVALVARGSFLQAFFTKNLAFNFLTVFS
jgi:hypothetical protein